MKITKRITNMEQIKYENLFFLEISVVLSPFILVTKFEIIINILPTIKRKVIYNWRKRLKKLISKECITIEAALEIL